MLLEAFERGGKGNGGGTGKERTAGLFLLGQGDNQLRTIKLDGLDVIALHLFLPFLNHYRVITSLKFIGTIRRKHRSFDPSCFGDSYSFLFSLLLKKIYIYIYK